MPKSQIVPWARGPFELIKHADGHLKLGGDTDRRIALIGFDNAIEVCIDVFIKLHPKLRGGIEFASEDVAKATRNYHSKIEWLDKYAEKKSLTLDFSIEEIVWYHSLRNELYHSGNGMVPEMHVLEAARSAAIAVFTTLFGEDVAPLLGKELTQSESKSERVLLPAQNNEMELLRLYIAFERALSDSMESLAPGSSKGPRSVGQMWREYKTLGKVPERWDSVVRRVMPIRNQIAHGHGDAVKPEEVIGATLQLVDLVKWIKGSEKR